jgi:hypothetical protein
MCYLTVHVVFLFLNIDNADLVSVTRCFSALGFSVILPNVKPRSGLVEDNEYKAMSERRVSDLSSDDERSALIDQVLLTHVQRKLVGEDAVDGDLVVQHPELMPELADRLRVFGEIAGLRRANEASDLCCQVPAT